MGVIGGGGRLLCAAAIALVLPAMAPADVAHADMERPNLLLLVAEDLGPRIGAFGDGVARTPNLDRLAREGVRYTNAFATAGVCAPSRPRSEDQARLGDWLPARPPSAGNSGA